MRIIMSGGSGLIGCASADELVSAGHTVEKVPTPRPAAHAEEEGAWRDAVAVWKPETFAGADALICLGGEPIYGLWTSAKKQRIINSRYFPARAMAEAAAAMERKPTVIVAASATGYYGDTGSNTVTEDSPRGFGYLAETTEQWERAWDPAREAGIRVVTVRFGVVLSPRGGALKVMLPIFKLGLGGWIGRGDQWFGWISLTDASRLIAWAAERDDVVGPLNATAPEPVDNKEFTLALGKALHRPTIFRVPNFAIRVLAGDAADETVLANSRVIPQKALSHGFQFRHPTIDQALASLK